MEIKALIKGDSSLTPAQKRTREILLYLIFGVLTTVVNLISFAVFDSIFGGQHNINHDVLLAINNTVAWTLAVLFAFVTNRTLVFSSKGPFFKEMLSFFASRVVTLLIFELGTMQLLVLLLELGFGMDRESMGLFGIKNIIIWKMINSVLVVIGNYILSKLFVFLVTKSAVKKADGESGKNA